MKFVIALEALLLAVAAVIALKRTKFLARTSTRPDPSVYELVEQKIVVIQDKLRKLNRQLDLRAGPVESGRKSGVR